MPDPQLVCLGELLIDFVSTTVGALREAPAFIKAPGGAPANVAAAAARLGVRAGFIGAVGDDEFGSFLAGELAGAGVDVRGLKMDPCGSTPLAFVSLRADAGRDFLFYWRDTADRLMKRRDVPIELVRSCRIFHFGSISLIHPGPRLVTRHALRAAQEAGAFISCDPNLRINLWPSGAAARRTILASLAAAHLVKVNDEELEFLTGEKDVAAGIRAIANWTSAAVVVTLGPRGASFRWRNAAGYVPGFTVAAVDSTGAGDGFTAGLLRCLLQRDGDLRRVRPSAADLSRWVKYANAVGALATAKRGAIPSFPTPAEVDALLRT
jgi:fructokinase